MARSTLFLVVGVLVGLLCAVGSSTAAAVDTTQSRFGNSKSDNIKIGAFNIQTFGRSKLGKADVMDRIIQILLRYDIVLVQEIRDITESVAPTVLNLLNSGSAEYDVRISERLGRTSYKEQYAFFYRTDKVEPMDTYQFQDPQDVFQREPYAVRFRIKNSYDFAMLAIHADPEEAVQELDDLAEVVDLVKSHWSLQNVLVAGDFNADCNYVRSADWENIRLWTEPQYTWLVGNDADTTTSATDCAYDRFVTTGSQLTSAVVERTATVYQFDQVLDLSYDETKEVSDHYPVEVQLRS